MSDHPDAPENGPEMGTEGPTEASETQTPAQNAQEALSGLVAADQMLWQPLAAPISQNLTVAFEGRVGTACAKHALGEQVDFAVGLTVIPQPDGRIVPAFALVVAIPSLVIGEKAHATAVVPNLWSDQDEADQVVGDLLGAIRESRARQVNGQDA